VNLRELYLERMPSWEKVLAFAALLALAALVGALLGIYGVSEDKLIWGCLIPIALLVGAELKTGRLVIGRSWDTVIATRDKSPRVYWTVIVVETAFFLLVIYGLATGTFARR
jgi:hypothetical protein